MDQIKIGNFIQEKRKEKNITQLELAERLGITDRAVSKWENGICLPDAGTMPELCSILDISINDLFSGEEVDMKNNEKKLEENLLEMTKAKEERDKQLLHVEYVVGLISIIVFIILVLLASYAPMKDWVRFVIIGVTTAAIILVALVLLKIEQVAGYYECKHCHNKYVPTYLSVQKAMHFGRTRYMKCPKCGKKSWQKKVLK